MAEISNNLLAGLLVVAIVISASSVFLISSIVVPIRITGRALEYGTANVTITGMVAIEMQRNVTDFDSSVLGGADREIHTQAIDNYGSFDDGSEGNGTDYGGCVNSEATCAWPFIVYNIGNQNVSINVSAASNASVWIGGNPDFAAAYYKGKNNESNACGINITGFSETGWYVLNETEFEVCNELEFDDNLDSLRIHFNLTIPSDTNPEAKGVIVTLGAIAS
jgi:hypothetical protein